MFDLLYFLGVIFVLMDMFLFHSCSFHCVYFWHFYVIFSPSVSCHCCKVLSVTVYASFSVSAYSSFLFGFSTPGFMMPISTPGVSISTPAVTAPSVVILASSMGMLLWSSKLRSSSSYTPMVERYSTHLTIDSGMGTTLNCLQVMHLPSFKHINV